MSHRDWQLFTNATSGMKMDFGEKYEKCREAVTTCDSACHNCRTMTKLLIPVSLIPQYPFFIGFLHDWKCYSPKLLLP